MIDDVHRAKVDAVIRALRAHPKGRPLSFAKRAVSHQVPKRNDKRRTDDKIELGPLDAILEIDVEKRTCTAEPGVTFEDLVKATLPLGLVPVVVPELNLGQLVLSVRAAAGATPVVPLNRVDGTLLRPDEIAACAHSALERMARR